MYEKSASAVNTCEDVAAPGPRYCCTRDTVAARCVSMAVASALPVLGASSVLVESIPSAARTASAKACACVRAAAAPLTSALTLEQPGAFGDFGQFAINCPKLSAALRKAA